MIAAQDRNSDKPATIPVEGPVSRGAARA